MTRRYQTQFFIRNKYRVHLHDLFETGVIKLRGFKVPEDNSPAKAFMRDVREQCYVNPLNDRALVWNNCAVLTLEISPSEPNTSVELKDIRAIEKGGGAKAMTMLCALADRHRVELYLYAKGYAHVPTANLVVYYKQFGFTDHGADLRYLDRVQDGEEHEGIDMSRAPR
jgi:hypothetical protein